MLKRHQLDHVARINKRRKVLCALPLWKLVRNFSAVMRRGTSLKSKKQNHNFIIAFRNVLIVKIKNKQKKHNCVREILKKLSWKSLKYHRDLRVGIVMVLGAFKQFVFNRKPKLSYPLTVTRVCLKKRQGIEGEKLSPQFFAL